MLQGPQTENSGDSGNRSGDGGGAGTTASPGRNPAGAGLVLIALRLTAQWGETRAAGTGLPERARDYAGVAACGDRPVGMTGVLGAGPAPTLDWGGSREEPSPQGARVWNSRADPGEAWADRGPVQRIPARDTRVPTDAQPTLTVPSSQRVPTSSLPGPEVKTDRRKQI